MTRAARVWIASFLVDPARPGDDLMAARALDAWHGLRRLNAAEIQWLQELETTARTPLHRRWAREFAEALVERCGEM